MDFMLNTRFVKMFHDVKQNFGHLTNSVAYNERMTSAQVEIDGDIDLHHMMEISKPQDLLEEGDQSNLDDAPPSSAICIIKPNQSLNVVLRTLRSIANINPDGLTFKDHNYTFISKIEFVSGYSPDQLDLLFKHDILFDPEISVSAKSRLKDQYFEMFQGQPVLQVMIHGTNAIAKLKSLIGPKDPARAAHSSKQADKGTLRSFYGVDRFDNAFFVSETVGEAETEAQVLFDKTANCDSRLDLTQTWQVTALQIQGSSGIQSHESTPVGRILL